VALALLLIAGGVVGGLAYTGIIHVPGSGNVSQAPSPTLTVSSPYTQGGTPAGAAGSALQISGKQFASNSRIMLLLDGQPAPDVPSAQSDGAGSVSLALTTPASWPLGQHTISAQDAQQHRPKQEVGIVLVEAGSAGTPGPNGAPADSATFTLTLTVQAVDTVTGQQRSSTFILKVKGRLDPAGGLPCQDKDTGQAQTTVETDPGTGTNYQNTTAWACMGSYKQGHLEYTETTLTNSAVFLQTGTRCDARTPYINAHIVGTFSNATSISGAFTSDAIRDSCTNGDNPTAVNAQTGTWMGTVTG
jgi:hypothetical protein